MYVFGWRVDGVEVVIVTINPQNRDRSKTQKPTRRPCPQHTHNTQVLKRKKMYEGQRDQLAAQSFNVDQVCVYVIR